MCYSAEASTYAFVFSSVSSLLLMQVEPALGAFFLFVGLMQLFDLVFWLNQDQSGSRINWVTTKVAMIANHLQPVVLAWMLMYFRDTQLSVETQTLLLTYVICIIIYTALAWRHTSYTKVTEKSYPSLYWEWNDMPGSSLVYALFLMSLVALIWEGFAYPVNIIMSALSVISFFLSAYYYKGRTAVGRFWCYFASYAPLLVLAMIKSF